MNLKKAIMKDSGVWGSITHSCMHRPCVNQVEVIVGIWQMPLIQVTQLKSMEEIDDQS